MSLEHVYDVTNPLSNPKRFRLGIFQIWKLRLRGIKWANLCGSKFHVLFAAPGLAGALVGSRTTQGKGAQVGKGWREGLSLSPDLTFGVLLLPCLSCRYFCKIWIQPLLIFPWEDLLLMRHLSFVFHSDFAGSNSWWSDEGKISSYWNCWQSFKNFTSSCVRLSWSHMSRIKPLPTLAE